MTRCALLALLSQIAAPAYILTCPYPCPSALTLCKRPNNGSLVQVLHRHFSKSAVRTEDPEKAQLFFIPVYLGRHYNWFWQQWSAPGKAWDVSRDCQPHHTPRRCLSPAPAWMFMIGRNHKYAPMSHQLSGSSLHIKNVGECSRVQKQLLLQLVIHKRNVIQHM